MWAIYEARISFQKSFIHWKFSSMRDTLTRAAASFFIHPLPWLCCNDGAEKNVKCSTFLRLFMPSWHRSLLRRHDAWMEFNHVDNNDEEIDIWKKTRDSLEYQNIHSKLFHVSTLSDFFSRVGFSFPFFISSSFLLHEVQTWNSIKSWNWWRHKVNKE